VKSKSIIAGLVGVILATAMVLCISCENGTQDVRITNADELSNKTIDDVTDVKITNEYTDMLDGPEKVNVKQNMAKIHYNNISDTILPDTATYYLNEVQIEWIPVSEATEYIVYAQRKNSSSGVINTWIARQSVGGEYDSIEPYEGPGYMLSEGYYTRTSLSSFNYYTYSPDGTTYTTTSVTPTIVANQIVSVSGAGIKDSDRWAITILIGENVAKNFSVRTSNLTTPSYYSYTAPCLGSFFNRFTSYTGITGSRYVYRFGVAAKGAISGNDNNALTGGRLASDSSITWSHSDAGPWMDLNITN